jgi:hypothetical protein
MVPVPMIATVLSELVTLITFRDVSSAPEADRSVRDFAAADLHREPRLSARQVRGHHRILVIRLVTEGERRARRRPAGKK